MFEFLRIQYKMGRVTANQLKGLISKVITAEQFDQIIENTNE